MFPSSSCCGQSSDDILLKDDGACSYKSYAGNDLGSHAREVMLIVTETILRHDAEECTAERYEEVGAETCILAAIFTLYADDSSKQHGCNEADEDHQHHLRQRLALAYCVIQFSKEFLWSK